MSFTHLISTDRARVAALKRAGLTQQEIGRQKALLQHRAEYSLRIGKYEVSVVISSKQAQLTRTITSPGNLTRKWDVEELVYEALLPGNTTDM